MFLKWGGEMRHVVTGRRIETSPGVLDSQALAGGWLCRGCMQASHLGGTTAHCQPLQQRGRCFSVQTRFREVLEVRCFLPVLIGSQQSQRLPPRGPQGPSPLAGVGWENSC